MFATLIKICMWKLKEYRKYVAGFDTFFGEMAVGIKFAGNHRIGPRHISDTLQEITLAIIITLGDHGTMQTENDAIDRQGIIKLFENFIAQIFISLALHKPTR